MVGTAVSGLVEELFEFGCKPVLDVRRRVNAETIVYVQALDGEILPTADGKDARVDGRLGKS